MSVLDPTTAGAITAVVGAVVGIGGLFLNRSSQREQRRQQQAANAAAQSKNRLDETQQALDATERRAERAEAGEEKLRLRVDLLESERDEQRTMHRAQYAVQESRCREVQAQLTDALIVLRGVVTDEVARSAATTAADVPPHPHTPTPTPDP